MGKPVWSDDRKQWRWHLASAGLLHIGGTAEVWLFAGKFHNPKLFLADAVLDHWPLGRQQPDTAPQARESERVAD